MCDDEMEIWKLGNGGDYYKHDVLEKGDGGPREEERPKKGNSFLGCYKSTPKLKQVEWHSPWGPGERNQVNFGGLPPGSRLSGAKTTLQRV